MSADFVPLLDGLVGCLPDEIADASAIQPQLI